MSVVDRVAALDIPSPRDSDQERRLVVVTAAADSVSHPSHQRQEQADDQEDDPDDQTNVGVGEGRYEGREEESEDDKDDSDGDHGVT